MTLPFQQFSQHAKPPQPTALPFHAAAAEQESGISQAS
jgi:hypothetical protein